MKVRTTVIIVFLSILLITSACESKKGKGTTTYGFVGGGDGIVSSFVTDNPPESVLDDKLEPFLISIDLENKGEYTVKENEILITLNGINQEMYSLITMSQRNTGFLDKVTPDQKGGTERINYEATYKSDVVADIPETIVAHICSRYQTKSVTQLCLRKDVTGRAKATDVCQITDPKNVGNSGAPVQVVQVLEKPAGKNKVSITFTIQNVGEGEVYEPAFITKLECASESFEEGKLGVTVESNVESPIECAKLGNKNVGIVRLVQGEASISCMLDTSSFATSTSEAPYTITLDYVYKTAITKPITIKNAL